MNWRGAVLPALAALLAPPAQADLGTASPTPLTFCGELYFASEFPFDQVSGQKDATPSKAFQVALSRLWAKGGDVDRRRFALNLAADFEAPGTATHAEGVEYILTNDVAIRQEIEHAIYAGINTCTKEFCPARDGALSAEFTSCDALIEAYDFANWIETRNWIEPRKSYDDWTRRKSPPP